jgi:hypothetical protein
LRRFPLLSRPEDTLSQVAHHPVGLPPVDGIPVGWFLGSVCGCPHLTSTSVDSRHVYLRTGHQIRVCALSGWVSPAGAGPIREVMRACGPLGFPLSFDPWHSLLGSSFSRWWVRPPLRLAYCQSPGRHRRGYRVPHEGHAVRVGASCYAGVSVSVAGPRKSPCRLTQHRRGIHHLRRPLPRAC